MMSNTPTEEREKCSTTVQQTFQGFSLSRFTVKSILKKYLQKVSIKLSHISFVNHTIMVKYFFLK